MSLWKRWLKSLKFVSRSAGRVSRKSTPRRVGVEHLEERLAPAATVWTDKPDYSPGMTAIIGGSGFQVGETVHLQILHRWPARLSVGEPALAGQGRRQLLHHAVPGRRRGVAQA